MRLVDRILQIFCFKAEQGSEKGSEEQYRRARSLILGAVDQEMDSQLQLSSLERADVQSMIDLLNQILFDGNLALEPKQRKRVLHLFTRLIKAAQVPPKSLELVGVKCDLSRGPIHEGGFGSVYKGVFRGRKVCVKVVRLYEGSDFEKARRAHASELAIWAHVSHPNVLPFYGTYPSQEAVQRICIVSPWMGNGSLAQYLKGARISRSERILLILDVVCGLEYIHDIDIIHSDLKASNVLISSSQRAMLADFGISIVAMTCAGTTSAADFGGTVNWMAPELLCEDVMPSPTRASDMWSFACTCYEVLAGEIPFEQYKPATLIAKFIMDEIGTSELKPTADDGMWPLMQRCLAREVNDRPTVKEAKQFITGLNVCDDRAPIDTASFTQTRRTPKIDYDRVHDVLQERIMNVAGRTGEEEGRKGVVRKGNDSGIGGGLEESESGIESKDSEGKEHQGTVTVLPTD